jgi:hypothetical protein
MTSKTMLRLLGALALTLLAACGNGSKGASDMGGSTDLAPPPCVMNPTTSAEILNACTDAQTGDPAKDYPYHPALAPNGNLPPLP